MGSGYLRPDLEAAPFRDKVAVKLEIEDPLEEEHGPLNKRCKPSSSSSQEVSDYSILFFFFFFLFILFYFLNVVWVLRNCMIFYPVLVNSCVFIIFTVELRRFKLLFWVQQWKDLEECDLRFFSFFFFFVHPIFHWKSNNVIWNGSRMMCLFVILTLIINIIFCKYHISE